MQKIDICASCGQYLFLLHPELKRTILEKDQGINRVELYYKEHVFSIDRIEDKVRICRTCQNVPIPIECKDRDIKIPEQLLRIKTPSF